MPKVKFNSKNSNGLTLLSEIDYCLIDNQFLKQYVYFMCMEKEYKPCTINLRISTLKCYCTWLYKNGYTKVNYSLILKKVKRPEDTIKPLSDQDVKKMLNQPNRNTYTGFRDFSIMEHLKCI